MVNKDQKSALQALTTAALCMPGIASQTTSAQAPPDDYKTSYRYSNYVEGDPNRSRQVLSDPEAPRYDIEVQQFYVSGPIGKSDIGFALNLNSETMTGASPWWIQPGDDGTPNVVMSGATIEEERDDVSLGFDFYKESAKTGIGFSYSTENDYDSLSLNITSTNWYHNNNTTIDLGFSVSNDSVTPTQKEGETRVTNESKRSLSGSAGFTRVINKNMVFGTSLAFAYYGGYLTDPYKKVFVDQSVLPENRPDEKQQMSFGMQVRNFFPSYNAALHSDYRFFSNTWGVASHTLRFAWYQNFGEHFQLVPQLRLYDQTPANFYRDYYLSERMDGYYSSDYRLSAFSSISGKLRASVIFEKVKIHISYENYQSSNSGDGIQSSNPALVDFETITAGFDLVW